MTSETLISYRTRNNEKVRLYLQNADNFHDGFQRLVLKHSGQRISNPIFAPESSAAIFSLVEALEDVAAEKPDADEFARHLDHHVDFFNVSTTPEMPTVIKTIDMRYLHQ